MFDIVTIGQLIGCDVIFADMPKLPGLGEEIFCDALHVKAGGMANTPIALSRLGMRVGTFAWLGKDVFGEIVKSELEKNGVDTRYVVMDPDYRTTLTAVLSTKQERGFATYLDDRKYSFSREDLGCAVGNSRGVFADVRTCQAMPEILQVVKENGKELYLDIGYVGSGGIGRYENILSAATVFMPNEQEACALTGKNDVCEAALELAGYVGIPVVKCGQKGCVAVLDGKCVAVPAYQADCRDTTGAGDTFDAGFLYGWLSGRHIEECMKLGNAAGSIAVGYIGSYGDALTKEALHEKAGF